MECRQNLRLSLNSWPIKTVALAICAVALHAPLASHAGTADLPEFQDMREQYRAVTKGKADGDATAEKFDQWQQQHPTEHLIGLYRGALNCLIARDAWFPWNKMRYANRCMDQMDESLQALEAGGQSTDLLHAYIERGFVNSHLPSMFGRKDMAVEDLIAAQQLPQWSELTEEEQQRILTRLSDIQDADSEE
ncbi:MAG: hypothetical protein K6L60_07755 [Oceanobacter sp.]